MFGRKRLEKDLDREVRSHLEMEAAEQEERGLPADEARYAAQRAFGNSLLVKEEVRQLWGWTRWGMFIRHVRYALRMLRKNPGFAVTIALTMALGIGATTAIYTVVYATLLAPLPYPQPNQLVNVWSKITGHRNGVSAGDFNDWKRRSSLFQDLNISGPDNFNIATQDRPEFSDGLRATPGYYEMLGVPFSLGRNFLPEEGEAGNEHVVILTHRLWLHLGANRDIIGQTMQVNGDPYRVVGIMAPGIADRWEWELIVPLVFKPEQVKSHVDRYWLVTGRLKTGATINQAQAEMDEITAREATEYPKSNQDWGALVEPLKNDFLPSDRQRTLWLLLGAVGFLLLIACLNIASLLLAKGLTRQREVAIRSALGAGPATIFLQYLTEGVLLAILGAFIGIASGYAILRGMVAAMPSGTLPAEATLDLNASVLLTMLAATTIAGLLMGAAPAWYASRLKPADVLKEGGRSGTGSSSHRLRRILVVAEFALALPLVAGAGLTIHSFWNLTHVDLGVRTDHILGFYLDPVQIEKDPNQEKVTSYYRRVLAGIEAAPGVSGVCAMSYLPLDSLHAEMPFAIAGQPEYKNPSLRPSADFQAVTPGYFETFGIRIVAGRTFTDHDDDASVRVAMVNEAFANRFMNGLDPLQRHLIMNQLIPGKPDGPTVEWQIVGIFHTVKSRGSREDNPEIDVPFWQEAYSVSGVGVRTVTNPAEMIKTIATAVNAVDPQAALALARTMEQVHDEVLANDRFMLILFAGFAVAGLLLATVGIYGVMAFSATQRLHEMALRMALGATPKRVLGLVMKEGLTLACTGIGVGLIGAYFVGRAMQSVLFGIGTIDLSAIGIVGLLLLLAAMLACYLPSLRAATLEIMQLLRSE